MMPDRETVFDAFRNCITVPKCRDCPWSQCEQFNQKKVTIPLTLALDVLNLLKKQMPVETEPTGDIFNIIHKCKNCGYTSILRTDNYCSRCGRKVVKWDD